MLSINAVQWLSHVQLFVTPWIAAHQASLCITNSRSSLRLTWLSESRCHPVISSSVIPFSSCPQSLPASESFLMSQLFASGGQSTGVSALASFLPKNTHDWSPLEWTSLILRYRVLHCHFQKTVLLLYGPLHYRIGEGSWEFLGLQVDPTSPF